MNVLFDHQIFYLQQYGGVSRYFAELLRLLSQRESIGVTFPLRWSTNAEAARLQTVFGRTYAPPPLTERLRLHGIAAKLRSLAYQTLPALDPGRQHQRYHLEELRRDRCDVFHPTYYEDYYVHADVRVPVVLTVFDMIQELYPALYSGRREREFMRQKRVVVGHATQLIAISQSTKNDLCRIYGIAPSKVTVVHLANSLTAAPASSTDAPELPERYLLFVGARAGYKNFSLFLQATAPLVTADHTLSIVCTGGPFTAAEHELLRSLALEGRVVNVPIGSDAALARLYANACAFVFPSLYEGFGLPVLEAMHYSCPVVVSGTSSFPEVAGNAVQYIDPSDAASIRDGVARVLGSATLRHELIGQGLAQEKKFSYERVADETTAVYRSVLR